MIHALVSGVITFGIALVLGLPILRYLRAAKAGDAISEYQTEGNKKKAGTPTFGGLIVVVPTLLVASVAVDWWKHQSILLPLALIGVTGAVGIVDDLGSLQGRRQTGLSWRFKITFTTAVACVAAWLLYDKIDVQSVNIPWEGKHELGLWYLPVAVAAIVGTTTAVAVSDGLDGLVGGTTLIAYVAYGIIAFIQGQEFVATFAFIIAGANLGFLWFNAHPAQVFMGDTGAMPMGCALAIIALMTGQWLLLPLIGIVFVIEAVSDIIQVGYFRLSGGKRFFKRAPYHMHLELSGWAETQVVTRAWLVAIAAAMLGVAFALAVPA